MKIVALLLLFFGEAFSIYVELLGARMVSDGSTAIKVFLKVFLFMILTGGFLLAGYIIGFKSFKNIWIVSTISITSILIIEPILNVLMFGQYPTRGASIGFSLGALGLLSAIFVK